MVLLITVDKNQGHHNGAQSHTYSRPPWFYCRSLQLPTHSCARAMGQWRHTCPSSPWCLPLLLSGMHFSISSGFIKWKENKNSSKQRSGFQCIFFFYLTLEYTGLTRVCWQLFGHYMNLRINHLTKKWKHKIPSCKIIMWAPVFTILWI